MNWIDNLRGLDVDSSGGLALAVGCAVAVFILVFLCLGVYGG